MRFIYWDEYSPTEFASRPARAPTIPAVTFKKLFAGQYLRLQVSQAHHDGNPDFRWTRGVAMTAPLTGLWEAKSSCHQWGCGAHEVSHHPVRCSDCNYQSIETDSTLRKHLVRICRAKVHGLCQSCGVAARAHPHRWCGLVTYFMPNDKCMAMFLRKMTSLTTTDTMLEVCLSTVDGWNPAPPAMYCIVAPLMLPPATPIISMLGWHRGWCRISAIHDCVCFLHLNTSNVKIQGVEGNPI